MMAFPQVIVKPARDRVPTEANHAPVIIFDIRHQSVVDLIEPARQFLGAALRTECLHQGIGQRGKTRYIGKESGAGGFIGEFETSRKGMAPIGGDIGV
jgi:hypothetical protein